MTVYYARRTSDGMIKIGYTGTAVWFRMRMLSREHGELQVLMTHAGHRAEEKAAHDRHSGRPTIWKYSAPAGTAARALSGPTGRYGFTPDRAR